MTTNFSNIIKHKSQLGQIKYSDAQGHYLFKGFTTGLALKYVAKGKENYYTNKQITSVREGHFILIRPGIHFEANTEKQATETQGLCIDLSMIFSKGDLKKILCNELLFNQTFSLPNSTIIGQQLNGISSAMQIGGQNFLENEPLIDIFTQLYTLSENIFQYKNEISLIAKKEATQQNIVHNILRAREYVVAHYTERITLDQLAQQVAMSKFQLLRLFKICFKCSPHEMQSTLRMQKARYLLQEDIASISQIAFDLGYFDIAAFSRKFKSCFGVPPSYFRN